MFGDSKFGTGPANTASGKPRISVIRDCVSIAPPSRYSRRCRGRAEISANAPDCRKLWAALPLQWLGKHVVTATGLAYGAAMSSRPKATC